MAPSNGSSLITRVALATREQQVDLEFSDRQLAQVTGVSRSTIARHRRGGAIRPELLIRLATALNTLELAAPPRPDPPGALVFDLERELAAWAGTAHQGGAA